MKILQIKFKNINSLKGEHFIDFEAEPLQSNSLFAITGPTGSGKSTLLDVICLALFNQIPRMNKVSKAELTKTGAVITRHQKEAFAEVVYESAAGKFLSHWDIQYNRNNNLNEYEMRIRNLITDEELDIKRSEVPAKNEALIGLNYTQFIKSILLAQGEFAKFLQAKDSERKQILEQITGTAIYRKLGMLAYEKAKAIQQEIALNKQRKSDVEAKLWEDEVYHKKQQAFQLKKDEKEKLVEELTALQKQKELVDEQKKWQIKFSQFEAKLAKIKVNIKQFNEANETKMQKHQHTQAFAEDLQDWQKWNEEVRHINAQIKQVSNEIEKLKEDKEKCLKVGSNLVQSDLSAENFSVKLEDFRQKVKALESDLKEVRSEYSFIKKPLQQDLESLSITCDLNKLEEAEIKIKQSASSLKNELNEIENLLNQNAIGEQDVNQLSNQIEMAVEAKQLDQTISNLKEQEDELNEQSKATEGEIAALPKQLEKLATDLKLSKLQLENLQLQEKQELLKASLEKHRANLKDGEACPLCGSLEHPFAEENPENKGEISAKIEKKKTEINTLEKQHQEQKRKLNQGETKLEGFQKQLKANLEKLEKSQQIWKERFQSLAEQKADSQWTEFIDKLKALRTALERKSKLKNQISLIDSVLVNLNDLQKIAIKGKKVRAELASIYNGKEIDNEVNSLKSNWDKLLENLRIKEESQQTISEDAKNLGSKLEKAEQDLLLQVKEKGFQNIEEAAASRLKELDYQALQNQLTELTQTQQQAEIDVKHTQQAIEELKGKITIEDLEHLQQNIQEKQLELKETEKLLLELSRTIENQKEFKKEIQALQKQIEQTQAKNENWLLMNELIGDKTGKKFNDFAQDLSLQHLLSMANKRLFKLNDRYQLDRPTKDEGDDLVAVDFHMGNERRSVRTLSGGETFVVSLALALALSDLASKNVSINSMFIDEGFGTLDPETLDQTLDTLERLQAESNKTIGIISHVEALKERIQTQIKLSKNGQGYSSLEVV
ncbi:AAA family ATPase [Psychroflexus planctonicus]|uniref:Nuclease SbcCD subunit C n=1 Tax=Psychroflexus planctonicus TaxID=1526575 RepID=A0ABQ1SHC1_9FLAO|nr:AAA family ATPase [Psychroflexus planctonicus]GGE35765.1 nuclease SbcCD subunit C [Psychroflexus planctonicus]